MELPRDIFPPPLDLLELFAWGAVVLVAAIFAVWFCQRWRKVQERKTRAANLLSLNSAADPASEPPVSPAEIANIRLLALAHLPLHTAPEWKEFHIQASFILRDYLLDQFQVPAHERTTDEILQLVDQKFTAAGHDLSTQLNYLLQNCDAVKFAQQVRQSQQAELWMERCKSFVEASE